MIDDRLAHMLQLQTELQKKYYGRHPLSLSDTERMEYVRVMTLALTDELHEVLRETDWKPWSKTPVKMINRSNYVSELADAAHFFLNLMIVAGVTAEDLYVAYLRKNGINHDREDNGYISPTG